MTAVKKDVENFVNFLALKIVQVIVQARLGERMSTKSKPHSSGSDWFHLAIQDLPEVLSETKKAMAGQFQAQGFSMCTEISLKTTEGDTLVLETWNLSMHEQCDRVVKASYTVYSRMGMLLKSLISVTRVTPAYKLSCRQGPDSYVICYRVYMGEPQHLLLGEDYEQVKIGQVGTPIGTLNLSVAYRTKLTITPQKVDKDCPFMVKSDYFKPDLSPQRPSQPHKSQPIIDWNKTNEIKLEHVIVASETKVDEMKFNGKHLDFTDLKKYGVFGSSENDEPILFPDSDVPFRCLLLDTDGGAEPVNKPKEQVTRVPSSSSANAQHEMAEGEVIQQPCHNSTASESSACGDFVMVEFKPPFAEVDSSCDLGAFFRDCQSAPQLQSFNANSQTLEEQVNQLSTQLSALETSATDFDDFVNSLCQDDL